MQGSAVVLSGNRLFRKGCVASRFHTIRLGQFHRRIYPFGNLSHHREIRHPLCRRPASVNQRL